MNPTGLIVHARRGRRSAGRRGFTLVELLIAMVAGLAVVLSVFALGRDATINFHQEMRIASTQMTQRIAAQRLRADIERIGFMGTGNIASDPLVAHCTKAAGACTSTADVLSYISTTETGLKNLMSVRLKVAGSYNASGNIVKTYSDYNSLTPDSIELAGNFTTTDEYSASIAQGASQCTGGDRIYLETKDPAVLRLMWSRSGVQDTSGAGVLAAFAPLGLGNGHRFAVRVSDFSLTHYQFVMLCGAANSIGIDGSGRAYVDTLRALMASDVGTGGVVYGQGAGSSVVVSPLQVVRWEIARHADAMDSASVAELSTSRFELIRTFVPADVAPFADVATNCPECQEVVAEFPIDLKFAFSIATGGTPGVSPPTGITDYKLDDSTMPTTIAPSAVATAGTPQTVRTVRFRLGFRTAMADRAFTLPGAPANFLYRYQLDSAGTQFARARETVEEVALLNQFSMNY